MATMGADTVVVMEVDTEVDMVAPPYTTPMSTTELLARRPNTTMDLLHPTTALPHITMAPLLITTVHLSITTLLPSSKDRPTLPTSGLGQGVTGLQEDIETQNMTMTNKTKQDHM